MPGMTSTTRTLTVASERARSFARLLIWLLFTPARRPQLEARDDGTRVHRDDLGLDAEILELELDQARHRLERFGRIAAFLRRRIVEQRQRRQLVRLRRLEQRHLPLALEPLASRAALTSTFSSTGSMRGAGALRLRPHLAHDLLPLLLRATAGPSQMRASPIHTFSSASPAVHGAAGAIHDSDPRHARRERHGREPQHEQQHGRAEQAEPVRETVADELAQDAARGLAHARGR